MPQEVAVLRDPASQDDDVVIQTKLWTNALGDLGFAIRHVDDALESGDDDELTRALDGCALVLVENLCSVPESALTPTVTAALAQHAARGGRVVFHHHALPWDPGWAERDAQHLPPRIDDAVHVGVSLRARRDLHAHGYEHVLAIHDHFDFDATGDRDATRAALGFSDDEIVLCQPTAATRTTNVAGAVRFVTMLHGAIPKQSLRYWLRGPIADDVAPTVGRLLERCPIPVTIGGPPVARRDALAACDVALVPSTWDASGAAAVESTIVRRPCVTGPFPVRGELQAIGLRFFDLDEPIELVKFLARPDSRVLDVNLRRARLSFGAEHLPAKVADVLMTMGFAT